MSDLEALRLESVRLSLDLTEADLEGIAMLLQKTRDGLQIVGPLPTEWLEPDYRFTPLEAAPRDD